MGMKRGLLIGLLCGMVFTLDAETLVIVSGENFSGGSLDMTTVRALYCGKRFRLGNQKIIPLNLGIDHPLRTQFEESVLDEDRDTLARNWLQAHYLGHHPPKVFKSSEAIAVFLTKVDNSIGYLDEETALKYQLKILFRIKE
jgi:hypothetical protein